MLTKTRLKELVLQALDSGDKCFVLDTFDALIAELELAEKRANKFEDQYSRLRYPDMTGR